MQKTVSAGERIATITLDGSECAVKFSRAYNAFSVRNSGDSDVYVALQSGKAAGDDGVLCVPSGLSDTYYHGRQLDTCYLIGDAGGTVTVRAQDSDTNSFLNAAKGGDNDDNETMPVMTGIAAYLEPSGIDLANGVWHNSIYDDCTNAVITGGSIDDNALKMTSSYSGYFTMNEPNTIYCIFKSTISTGSWRFILGKQHSGTHYGFWISLSDAKNYISVDTNNGAASSTVLPTDYHVVAITGDTGNASLYIDSDYCCSTGFRYRGSYNYKVTIAPAVATWFRFAAFGVAEHTAEEIQRNSIYLAKKFI